MHAAGIQNNTPPAPLLAFHVTNVERKTTTRESASEKVNRILLIVTRSIALVITDIVQPHRTFGINETTTMISVRRAKPDARNIGNNHSDDSSSDDEYFLNHLKTHHTSKDNTDK